MGNFVDSVIKQAVVPCGEATHFAIMNGDKVRYYIALNRNGITNRASKKRLTANIATYSTKLKLLMKLLLVTPYRLLQFAHIGSFVKLEIDSTVKAVFDEVQSKLFIGNEIAWNVIIGNYVEKQKLVFQCFSADKKHPAMFVKVGGHNSNKEMTAETKYLENPIRTTVFSNPKLIFSKKMSCGYKLNIQITEEFTGDRVEPKFSQDIYAIFLSISHFVPLQEVNGVLIGFSHGDFTPWNVKKKNNEYIVYDWEYNGIRFYGYDLIHFLYQVEVHLNGNDSKSAILKAIGTAKIYDDIVRDMDSTVLSSMYFEEVIKNFGHR